MKVFSGALLILFLGGFTVIYGQDPSREGEVLRIETQAVEVPVSVTDRSGRPVTSLKPSNFAVFEDGKQQEIVDFVSAAAPFEVALILDTSGSTRGDLGLIRKAARDFLQRIRSGDKVSIISYQTERKLGASKAVTAVMSPLTDDRAELNRALERLGSSNGTPFYDSLLQATNAVFSDEPSAEFRGRRALVALTDGVDSVSESEFIQARDALSSAGLSVYFIRIDTREFFEKKMVGDCSRAMRFSAAQLKRYYERVARNPEIEKVYDFCRLGASERLTISKALYQIADEQMKELTSLSGGSIVPVRKVSDAKDAFRKVAEAIGTKYSLIYYSNNEQKDGAFRRIKVELRDVPAGSSVRAREGYFAPID